MQNFLSRPLCDLNLFLNLTRANDLSIPKTQILMALNINVYRASWTQIIVVGILISYVFPAIGDALPRLGRMFPLRARQALESSVKGAATTKEGTGGVIEGGLGGRGMGMASIKNGFKTANLA